ncbi:GATOR complex protein DEPDC5 [Lingula anatina]|uniref:GATOR complex protein DEPDC5 n=1 Tax=Lingula anatina TaxID=7574 RepID=A0A1S3HEX7_LINAN|nr:GATOR complex protein DEPDC5 [Lingula anatina]|eukprot:XP_013383589.1 GATOR complex protein DEPDC5 [Lingula anatina]
MTVVSLDLMELIIKDQYLSRSDMWRFTKSLRNTCMYVGKKVDFIGMRAQVNELWAKGDKMTCGYVSEDTRIVYRSSTAVVHIFLQMSSEMWEFDAFGDLYFEKAVSGFLTDLFVKWKEQNCLHDVTIVMFSRTFYDAHSLEDFPESMRECIQQDYKGRFYEDFYRVVVQNECYKEWTGVLVDLKQFFIDYPKTTIQYHQDQGAKVPKAWNSTAAMGNFLEVLNMSLNVYEKYYIDRNFDRLGKVAIVVTPGAGVFEVDRELTTMTKQRTIDTGMGSDLVCMGEQPLHAVPLFRFHSSTPNDFLDVGDDYHIPHWINHSFYTSRSQIQTTSSLSFVPRIKLAKMKPNVKDKEDIENIVDGMSEEDDRLPFVDYDEYDAQVFKLPNSRTRTPKSRNTRSAASLYSSARKTPQSLNEAMAIKRPRNRTISDDVSGLLSDDQSVGKRSPAIGIPGKVKSADLLSTSLGTIPIPLAEISTSQHSVGSEDSDDFMERPVVGSAGFPAGHHLPAQFRHPPRRALINPFAPSRMRFKMTSNRRRWVHAFPLDQQGAAILPHHQYSQRHRRDQWKRTGPSPTREVILAANRAVEARKYRHSEGHDHEMDIKRSKSPTVSSEGSMESEMTTPVHRSVSKDSNLRGLKTVDSTASLTSEDAGSIVSVINVHETPSYSSTSKLSSLRTPSISKEIGKKLAGSKSWQWGPVTGEQEWSPTITTGVDWRSMSLPAVLPMSTDFFPDKRSLHNDYVISEYKLLPDVINSDISYECRSNKRPMTTMEVFKELIYQRFGQGFQVIVGPKNSSPNNQSDLSTSPMYKGTASLIRARSRTIQSEEYRLSIGRIYHKVNLTGPEITVVRYRPRHPYTLRTVHYKYRFKCPDSVNYDVSWVTFKNQQLENYNWNYLDNYICTKGEGDYGLMESLKYWKSRFLLLPCHNPATKKIIDGAERCDVYEEKSLEEQQQMTEGFVKILEMLNKIRRPGQGRKPGLTPVSADSTVIAPADATAKTDSTPAKDNVNQIQEEKLSMSSPLSAVLKKMQDPSNGLKFLPVQEGLPSQSFVSFEATEWVQENVEGAAGFPTAVALLQTMVDEKMICHGCRNTRHRYIHGFYLYFVVTEKERVDSDPLSYAQQDALTFQNDWIEVTVHNNMQKPHYQVPPFLMPLLPQRAGTTDILSVTPEDAKSAHGWGGRRLTDEFGQTTYKHIKIDTDPASKCGRPEWCTMRYHANYNPLCAYELTLNWLVCTGPVLGELVSGWVRKVSTCSYHLLAVPVDPFALPYTDNSDPLRGPIYVPLNVQCLTDDEISPVFSEYDSDSRSERLRLLQEFILKRFGFMLDSCLVQTPRPLNYQSDDTKPQWVHCTGGMFVMIPDSAASAIPENSTCLTDRRMPNPTAMHKLFTKSNAHKDYIERQRNRADSVNISFSSDISAGTEDIKVGFLWCWNSMLSKRWRSPNTGDESFQDKVLADFRAFCSNQDNRLREFWEQCHEQLQSATPNGNM